MNATHSSTGRTLSRRAFLRGTGFVLALPFLEAMRPVFGASAKAANAAGAAPRRMVCIETNMGIMPQFFFPEKPGRDFTPSPYLERLAAHRENITVFSGVSHPGVTGGHAAERCFMTGTPHPERGGFRNWISLDQFAAEQIGNQTRYPSLVVAMTSENATLSYTRSGAPIPAERSPKKLFQKLFVQGKPEEVAASVEALRQGRSMLDFLGWPIEAAEPLAVARATRTAWINTSPPCASLNSGCTAREAWEQKPKPVVAAKMPEDIEDAREFIAKTKLMFDVMKLAMETDSTRVISLFIDTTVIHNITHHGGRPEVIAELRAKEEGQFDALNGFLTALGGTKEESDSLLDRTMVLYGTPMGSANSHSNVNLPVLLAGGGFKHGQHLAFDTTNNYPLANLYLSMLQRLGIEAEAFSTSKGTMRGLELA